MNNYSTQIKKIIHDVKQHIHIPNHLEYEAAFDSEDGRLLALFDESYAEELFSSGVLNMHNLSKANSLEELTNVIDHFTSIVNFYHDNHKIFSLMVEEPFFQKQILEKGDLNCWSEVMLHSYKKLNYQQAKTLVLDSLSRLHADNKHEEEKHHLSHV